MHKQTTIVVTLLWSEQGEPNRRVFVFHTEVRVPDFGKMIRKAQQEAGCGLCNAEVDVFHYREDQNGFKAIRTEPTIHKQDISPQ